MGSNPTASAKFAEIACWCKHDCCEVDNDRELMLIFGKGNVPLRYVCDYCECHDILDWWDPWDLMG